MVIGLIGKIAKQAIKKSGKKKPTKRDYAKEEREGNKKFEESQRKKSREWDKRKRARDAENIKKEEARIKSKAPPKNWMEAAKDKEYATRKAYDKKHGSTANRINTKLKQLKNEEVRSKHNRN